MSGKKRQELRRRELRRGSLGGGSLGGGSLGGGSLGSQSACTLSICGAIKRPSEPISMHLINLRREAHIEHSICLVEHHVPACIQVRHRRVGERKQVIEPPWGADN